MRFHKKIENFCISKESTAIEKTTHKWEKHLQIIYLYIKDLYLEYIGTFSS